MPPPAHWTPEVPLAQFAYHGTLIPLNQSGRARSIYDHGLNLGRGQPDNELSLSRQPTRVSSHSTILSLGYLPIGVF